MITKTQNPNNALDLFEIEQRARALRAETMRAYGRNLRAWISSNLSQPRLQFAKG